MFLRSLIKCHCRAFISLTQLLMFSSMKCILKFSTTLCIVSLQFLTGAVGKLSLEGEQFESFASDKRFLHDQTSTKVWATLEQYAACSLLCVQGYEKLAEVCCNAGSDAVCLNLPWDILKNHLGQCSGIHTTIQSSASASASLQQFAACSLTCVAGYEKLTEVCCKSGISDVCSNLPWDILKTHLGSCKAANNSQTHCLSCSDVIQPSYCNHTVLCSSGEVCYTEFINLNGEERYRLGCVEKTACAKSQLTTTATSLVGKKRFIMDGMKIDKYCSKCCSDDFGNCNRELCHTSGVVPTGIDVFELVNPPARYDFCTDLYPDACKILIIQDPALCKQPRFSHYACREYCGTCVNPGHMTAQPPATATVVSVTTSSPTPTQVSSTDCFYESTKYMGAYASTISGKPCMKWSDIDPNIQGIPDNTLAGAGNKCRDPDGRGFPWCYTSMFLDWEFCPVPYCKECFYRNESVHYTGYVAHTITNETCISWSSSAFALGNSSYLASKIYCRDPFSSGTPQCFTGNGLRDCDVPVCPHSCQDNSETNCDLIKQYVCKYEYPGVTLCPKTCGFCKFGLLPPKIIDPPKDVCVDNADANCETLKFIICGDPDGATKLCPKTCGKCSLLLGSTTNNPTTVVRKSGVAVTDNVPLYTQKNTSTILAQPSVTTFTTPTTTFTSPTTTFTTPATTSTATPSIMPVPYWLSWGEWKCEIQLNACFQRRFRNCSTGNDKDCIDVIGGVRYRIDICTTTSCPEYFTTTSQPSTPAPQGTCQDDPTATGCKIPDILSEVCKDKRAAWKLCPASCNLCDTCWDFLDCSSASAKNLFCSTEEKAVQYCRQTCGKCDRRPVRPKLNGCGDPVENETTCVDLQRALCICNDPTLRPLCRNYCDNKCSHPYVGSECTLTSGRNRNVKIALQRLGFL